MKKLIAFLVSCAALYCGAAFPQAKPFPQRAVTLIVPWATGGGTDFVARKFAAQLAELWGQPVIVENVPGASSIIGAQRVARAAPDGYTLMVTTNGTIVGNRFLIKKLPYDPDRDLIPVTQLTNIDMVILAHISVPANNLRELIDLARKEPGRITYASYGMGSQPQLLFELLNKRESIQLLHVPYKGVGPALVSVMAGETNLTLTGRGTGDAAIKSGKTKVIAYMSEARDPSYPDVPTTTEAGYPYLKVPTWQGMFAPPNTPKELLDRIQRDVASVARRPEFHKDLTSRGYGLPVSTPEEYAAALRQEVKQTAEMVEAAGLQPE